MYMYMCTYSVVRQQRDTLCKAWSFNCQAPLRDTTNLAEHVLGWQGVAPTSVPFKDAIKTSCLQKVVFTYSSLSGASGLIIATSKWQKKSCD